MKLIILVLGILLFSFENLAAQTILAGQTTGQYILYSDIEDVSLQADSSYTFDFDQDGIVDLKISCFWYTTHVGYNKGIIAEPYNNTQLSDYSDMPDWSIKYAANAVIGENCFWTAQYGILREHIWYITSGESFLGQWDYGDGYLGFRILNATDTIVGWIGLNTISEESVLIYDYAFYSVHLGAETLEKPVWEVRYNSLVKDKLIISFNHQFDGNLDYCCLNRTGQVMANGKLNNEGSELNLNSFPPGLYFCRISSRSQGGFYEVLKFIKE